MIATAARPLPDAFAHRASLLTDAMGRNPLPDGVPALPACADAADAVTLGSTARPVPTRPSTLLCALPTSTDTGIDRARRSAIDLFREAVNQCAAPQLVLPVLAAAEALDRVGWSFQGSHYVFAQLATGVPKAIGLYDPAGRECGSLPMADLPLLSDLLGLTSLSGGTAATEIRELAPYLDRGVTLTPRWTDVQGEGRDVEALLLVKSVEALRNGDRVSVRQGKVELPLEERTASTLFTRIEALLPLFEVCQRSHPLTQAISACSLGDRSALARAIQGLSNTEKTAHLEALATLARAGCVVDGYSGLVSDYRAMLDMCDDASSLAQRAADYAKVLSALATVGRASEAAQTYRAIHEAVRADESGETFDDKARRLLEVLARGGSSESGRQAALHGPRTGGATVERGAHVVRIGGVAVPVRR